MRNSYPFRYWEMVFVIGAVGFAWKHDAWSTAIMFAGALAYIWYPFGKRTDKPEAKL